MIRIKIFLVSSFLFISQIYWLPEISKYPLDVLKFILILLLYYVETNLLRDKRGNMILLTVLGLISLYDFNLGLKILLILVLYLNSKSQFNFKVDGKVLIFFSVLIFFPSLSYFFPNLEKIYVPSKYYDTHYYWLNFYNVGFSGVSTAYGYTVLFTLCLILYNYQGKFKIYLWAFALLASFLSGSLLSIIFSLSAVINFYFKVKIYFYLLFILIFIGFASTEFIFELANQRFEMYDIFQKLDIFYLIFEGNQDLLFNDDGLKFHNGYVTTIMEFGFFGFLIVFYIVHQVFKDLKRNNWFVTPLTIFFIFNMFEPSNIFGNWASLIPIWWFLFNSKNYVRNFIYQRI